jgi:hypothetical protein
MKKSSKKVVVDACIARSSGFREIPASENSRNFLEMLRETDHLVAFNKDLSDEWNRHQSSFARKWRLTMVAKRKVVFVESFENMRLRDSLSRAVIQKKKLQAAMKDIHLVELALQTDKFIISGDNEVRLIFWDSSEKIPLLKDIIWFNPIEQFDFVMNWFKEGAKITKEIHLVNLGREIFMEAAPAKTSKTKKYK